MVCSAVRLAQWEHHQNLTGQEALLERLLICLDVPRILGVAHGAREEPRGVSGSQSREDLQGLGRRTPGGEEAEVSH